MYFAKPAVTTFPRCSTVSFQHRERQPPRKTNYAQVQLLAVIGCLQCLCDDFTYSQRHVFETVRLCYPSGFYDDCVRQLRLDTMLQQLDSVDETFLAQSCRRHGSSRTPREVSGERLRRKSWCGRPSATGSTISSKLGRQSSGIRLEPLPADDVAMPRKRAGRQSAVSMDSLPLDVQGQGLLLPSDVRRLSIQKVANPVAYSRLQRRLSANISGVEMEHKNVHSRDTTKWDDRNGYWDILGVSIKGRGARGAWDTAEYTEVLASAIGAVVMLRWALKGIKKTEIPPRGAELVMRGTQETGVPQRGAELAGCGAMEVSAQLPGEVRDAHAQLRLFAVRFEHQGQERTSRSPRRSSRRSQRCLRVR